MDNRTADFGRSVLGENSSPELLRFSLVKKGKKEKRKKGKKEKRNGKSLRQSGNNDHRY